MEQVRAKSVSMIAVVSLVMFQGCESLTARTYLSKQGLYPGIRYAFRKNHSDNFMTSEEMGRVQAMADLPFTFALDTVLLPHDLIFSRVRKPAPVNEQ